MRPQLALFLCLTGTALGQSPSTPPWVPLFDGASMAGWEAHGGAAEYRIQDGVLIGASIPGQPNGFLVSTREVADFELELDLKIDPRLNSGVQIRSALRERKDGSDFVLGYQVEVDPSERSWSGGIYDESRRGWIHDLAANDAARAAFRRDDWNHYRILCEGPRIRTWVNGVAAADLIDAETIRGILALQVHGVGSDPDAAGREVHWRNIRMRDLGAHAWTPMFDGKTLEGWTARGPGRWTVEDGVLLGESDAEEAGHGILLSQTGADDFTLRIEYRAVRGNSGLYFRCDPVDRRVGVHGFQAEIDPDPSAPNGGLYETGGRGWVSRPVKSKFRPGKWNTMTVHAEGPRILVWINGERCTDFCDESGRREGRFGLQLHGGQDMRIEVRRIERLEKAPSER